MNFSTLMRPAVTAFAIIGFSTAAQAWAPAGIDWSSAEDKRMSAAATAMPQLSLDGPFDCQASSAIVDAQSKPRTISLVRVFDRCVEPADRTLGRAFYPDLA